MNLTKTNLLAILLTMSLGAMLLVLDVVVRYSYSKETAIEAAVGFAILLAVSGFLWRYRRHALRVLNEAALQPTLLLGTGLGLLWMMEISINNFIAPPLPARDIIDNLFWAVIALAILLFAGIQAYQRTSIISGIAAGLWSGSVSGLFACCMALAIIVFAMHLIEQDPLNVAEWAERGPGSSAPTLAAYFAFETFTGAFAHLLVLGVLMGGLLGVVGGVGGKGLKLAGGWLRRP